MLNGIGTRIHVNLHHKRFPNGLPLAQNVKTDLSH